MKKVKIKNLNLMLKIYPSKAQSGEIPKLKGERKYLGEKGNQTLGICEVRDNAKIKKKEQKGESFSKEKERKNNINFKTNALKARK